MYDIKAEKSVKKHRLYYHVTSKENVAEIKKNGLKANEEGHIFVITDMIVADEIAANQCFLREYAVFMIDSRGITGKVIRDRVAELSASYHRIIIQEKISKRYVHFLLDCKVDWDQPSEFDLLVLMRSMGLSKADAEKEFHRRRMIIQKGGVLKQNQGQGKESD